MQRGDVFDARLSPTEGSEQAGTRPVVIVSRNAINQYGSVVVVVPLTDAANIKRIYPGHVLVEHPEGGLALDSMVLTGQVRAIAKSRLIRQRGSVSQATLDRIDDALRITLDL